MYLRYLIWNEFGECIRKMASRIECEPYVQQGCTLTVLPKPKQPTASNKFDGALQLLGVAPF
jgi:hypothetical protein